MKGFSVIIITLMIWVIQGLAQTPRKHALLIGVSEYSRGIDEDEEWWNLNSKSDIEAIRQILVRKFNFKPTEIKSLLTRQQTTRQSILNAFKNLSAKAEAGDIIYLHYSGHGSQVLDDNGDEIDGLDETLVPSDYKTRQDGSRNLRDDEIGKFLNELKAKNPANVTLIFDSCFSGTVTRGGRQLVRGESYRGETAKVNPTATTESTTGLIPQNSLASNFVIISATRSDQTAKETDNDTDGKIGALTYSLIKAFHEANPTSTYRDIFDKVQTIVAQRVEAQNPQIEGETDSLILKGTANPAEPYILISSDKQKNAILQAGSLQGMTQGSKFAIYPNGTKSPNEGKKLADGEIIQLEATTAKLRLSAPIPSTARAFETERKYSETLLKLAVTDSNRLTELQKIPLVEITQQNDWDLRISQNGAKILLERSDGAKLLELETGENLAQNIRLALEREIRFRTIRSLENSSLELKIEIRVVPVEVEKNERGGVTKIIADKEFKRDENGKFQLSENDFVTIEIRNTGQQDAWITILNLKNDGKISPMFPHPRVSKFDNKIVADGKWKRLPMPFVYRITPPFGNEIYKVIATLEPTDFSPLLDFNLASGNDVRVRDATKSPLGKILRSATLARRSDTDHAPPPNWATAEISFEVKNK